MSNTAISKELYDHLPRQRRLNENEYIVVKDALSLKANKKMIQHKIQRETGKKRPPLKIYRIFAKVVKILMEMKSKL